MDKVETRSEARVFHLQVEYDKGIGKLNRDYGQHQPFLWQIALKVHTCLVHMNRDLDKLNAMGRALKENPTGPKKDIFWRMTGFFCKG